MAYSVVFLCCFFGNLLVMVVVVLHRRMRTATNFFLANLAFADFCVGIFCVYQNLMLYLTSSWTLGDLLCRMYHFVHGLSYTASILFLAIISLERYVVIVHPMWGKRFITPRRLRVALVILWLVSAVYNSPRLVLYGTVNVPSWTEEDEISTICVIQRSVYNSFHFDLYNFIFLFVFPLMLMGILYTKIAVKLWSSQRLHGRKVQNFLCCLVKRKVKIIRQVNIEVDKSTADSLVSKISQKKASFKELPEHQRLPTLQEVGATTFHKQSTLEFESSGEEEHADSEEEEELLEYYKRGSTRSMPSMKININRSSFPRPKSIQEEPKYLKSVNSSLVNKETTSKSKFQSNEEGSSSKIGTNKMDCLAKCPSDQIQSFPNSDLRTSTISNISELSEGKEVTISTEKSNMAVKRETDTKNTSNDITVLVIDNASKFSSLVSDLDCLPATKINSPIRRGSEPPTYLAPKPQLRRASEPLTYIKSFLHLGQTEESSEPRELKESRKGRRRWSKVIRSRRKIIRLLVVILWTFAICNLPYHARKLWQFWSPFYNGSSDTSLFLTLSTTLILYMNSGVNPFLYALLSVNFRNCIKDVISLRTHLWTTAGGYSPKSSNNSKSTQASSTTAASRGSKTSAEPNV